MLLSVEMQSGDSAHNHLVQVHVFSKGIIALAREVVCIELHAPCMDLRPDGEI